MNTRIAKSILLQIAIISGVLLLGPFRVDALSISPPRVELQGNPGETVKQDMTLTNDTKNTQIFYSSFANFEAQGETGNPAFTESKDDLDKWMSTETSVALKPGQSIIVPVSINIPNTAEAGGHFAAVFWGTTPNVTGASSVSIGAKIGMLVLLSVSGDVKEAGGLVSFSTLNHKTWYTTLPVSFEYRFKNDGGDRIKPVGKITMHDIVYIPEDKIDANPGSGNILPNSTRHFTVDWVKNPRDKDYVAPTGKINQFFNQALYEWHNFAFGPYFAKMSLLYGTNATRVSKTAFFFVFPWQLLICLLVIFIIVFWGGRKLIRRYNRHIIQKARVGMNNTQNEANHV
jgi:hypothetical protein